MEVLDQIQTIIIVMMENRSFDNVLGHLSMPLYGNRKDVNGLVNIETNASYINFLDKQAYRPFHLQDGPLPYDLPHSRSMVATQLAKKGNTFTMSGFVEAYYLQTKSKIETPPPMGFLSPMDTPMSSFLANQYAVCDNWFAPVPADTQPNRSVAYSGYATVDDTKPRPIPIVPGSFIFDWLDEHHVSWRVYHSGFSFFTLFDRFDDVLGPNFHSFKDLPTDWGEESLEKMPQVVFIEPSYTDSPIHFGWIPSDNHPPTPIGPGEHFLREVYSALVHNQEKWQRSLLIVVYDEHGGFFDHVLPNMISSPVPAESLYANAFESTGPRVPALFASPWIAPHKVCNSLMDHTSILQLLSEKFASSPDYNDEVKRRRELGIQSASQVFTSDLISPRVDISPPPQDTIHKSSLIAPTMSPNTDSQHTFFSAAKRLSDYDYQRAIKKFPGLSYLKNL
ncbi:alkaline phosphatase family protein [Candidatus Nitrosacidococcus tergens]|uniref:Phospholipase C 4 n=1 Tax=Candidatus Nitrosacidococcus tergens TaxID=553981 RepID=A0A7G1Q878_9GAMM|nr:alkaline phosphatase family protein [Candidatus Nitrosacidococcus tergens]CAB1275034.1 Phospholipase C 4 [Candidatus Nitrosacidococcus tergens]